MGTFDLTLGPILMGTLITVLLLGIMIVQCYLYFERYREDKVWMGPMVLLLLLLDCLSTAFDIQSTYRYVVTDFDYTPAIAILNTGFMPYPFFTGFTALIVQCFFAWRVKKLIGSPVLAYAIVALSTIQWLASLGTMIGGIILKDYRKLPLLKQISLIWLLGSVVTDIIITVSLVWFLRRSRTGFNTVTDRVANRVIALTMQTGLLTAAFALGVVLAYLIAPWTTMHLAFGVPLSKLYTNSLMSQLNSRKAWNPDDYKSKQARTTLPGPTFRTEIRTDTTIQVHHDAASSVENHELYLVNSGPLIISDDSTSVDKAGYIV